MKIAIIADSHDNLENIQKFFEIIQEKNIAMIFHCGDICNSNTIKKLTQTELKIHAVCGNNDEYEYLKSYCSNTNINLIQDIGEMEIDGIKIAMTHYPKVCEYLASLGKYDIIFYGHTHRKKTDTINKTKIVNPGDLEGRFRNPSFVIFDTVQNEIDFINIK